MKIAIGSDEVAFAFKQMVMAFLAEEEIEYVDFGVTSESDTEFYADVAERVALAVTKGGFERGILLCGTGLGMAIVANKIPGARAATCHDVFQAERSRKSNDAQIISMGARVIGPESAKTILKAWLASEFAGGRSAPKVQRVNEVEHKYLKE